MLRFSLQPQEFNLSGYLRYLYRLKNSPVEVLTITLYKHHPCRGYPFRKEALITDLMSSWNRHTPDLWACLYKVDLFRSTLFYKGALILNCRYSLQAGKFKLTCYSASSSEHQLLVQSDPSDHFKRNNTWPNCEYFNQKMRRNELLRHCYLFHKESSCRKLRTHLTIFSSGILEYNNMVYYHLIVQAFNWQ